MTIVRQVDLIIVEVRVQKFPRSVWLEDGWEWPQSNDELLPTFTRFIRRDRPFRRTAGLERASYLAMERWEQDDFSRQVDKYEDEVMARTAALVPEDCPP